MSGTNPGEAAQAPASRRLPLVPEQRMCHTMFFVSSMRDSFQAIGLLQWSPNSSSVEERDEEYSEGNITLAHKPRTRKADEPIKGQ